MLFKYTSRFIKIYRNLLNHVFFYHQIGVSCKMKGRTVCPNCKYEFILDLPEDKKHEVICPNCRYKYLIQAKRRKEEDDECKWEEHGEPRKTVLSKIKPRTNKPIISAILLVCVFVLGVTTAVFSEQFIESTLDVGSAVGLSGDVKISVIDFENKSVNNVTVKIGNIIKETDNKGLVNFKKVKLGIQKIEVNKSDYPKQVEEHLILPFFTNDILVKYNTTLGADEYIIKEFDRIGCSLIIGIFSVFPLLGFISCWKRRNLDIAIAGAGIGIFSFGFLFIGSILSIIAICFILKSRDEFENGKKGKTF